MTSALLEDDKADGDHCGQPRRSAAGGCTTQFIVDVIQGGAGTSANMNANEVVANRALELLGHQRGEYRSCIRIDDVNMGQSTNDVYPTAVNVALHWPCSACSRRMGVAAASPSPQGRQVHRRDEDRAHPAAGRRAR